MYEIRVRPHSSTSSGNAIMNDKNKRCDDAALVPPVVLEEIVRRSKSIQVDI